jgi:hypothetical protein
MSVLADARRLAAPVGRPLRRALVGLRTRSWPPHSRLFVQQESAQWVLAYEARQLERTARALGVELGHPGGRRGECPGDLPPEPVHCSCTASSAAATTSASPGSTAARARGHARVRRLLRDDGGGIRRSTASR